MPSPRSATPPARTQTPPPEIEIIPPGAEPDPTLPVYLSELASGRDDLPRKTPMRAGSYAWVPVFLHTLRNSGNVRAACQRAGIDRGTAIAYRSRSQKFHKQWDLAMADFGDLLQARCVERSKTSDLLLMFVTKKFIPEYRDNYDARKEATATFWQGANGDRAMSIQIKWPDKAVDLPDDEEL